MCQSTDNPTGGEASDAAYWSQRYHASLTGWDAGRITTPIKELFDGLEDKDLRILIPGAGNGHEAEYAWKQGFRNVVVLDIAPEPLAALQQRVPDFPAEQMVCGDFFQYEGEYDLIVEQTFFCSFPPTPANRKAYAAKMHDLLVPGGRLAGLWFDIPLADGQQKRPFGGSRAEYLSYFEPYFNVIRFSTASNSIPPRAGRELFGVFQKTT
ncbi:SAM-dependent methyltransferase [Lewinella sp. 4G2]|nr:SAM-dependent methyltransferase [Lewinella sp. 4G2]